MANAQKKKPRTRRCLNCLAGALYLFYLVSISPAQAGSLTDTSGLQRKLEAVAKGIENCWSKVKEFLRSVAARSREALDEVIANALDAIVSKDIQNYFTHCCYCIPLS